MYVTKAFNELCRTPLGFASRSVNVSLNSYNRCVLLQRQSLIKLLLECLHEVQDPKHKNTLYRLVAKEWGGEHVLVHFPSSIACFSAGYLLPQLLPPYIELYVLNDQGIVQFMKGLGRGCVDHPQPRSGLGITFRNLLLRGHDGLQAIAQLLHSSFGISYLRLSFRSASINPSLVRKCIGETMATNQSVRTLILEWLESDSMGPSGENPVPELSEMMKKNKTLETLTFRFCSVPYLASTAQGLEHNTTLKELVLEYCDVTDTGVKSLAEMLLNNKTLENLTLSKVILSAESVGHLAEALKGNSTLRVLKLNRDSVCRNPEALAVAFTVNTNLQVLAIGGFGEESVSEDLTEKLMANGVALQLLTIAIERTVSECGVEETGHALMSVMLEWIYC